MEGTRGIPRDSLYRLIALYLNLDPLNDPIVISFDYMRDSLWWQHSEMYH